MDHLTVPDIDTHMCSVAHDVSRLWIADRHTAASLCLGSPGKGNARHRVTVLHKSGAVKSHTWGGAAVYIGYIQLAVRCVYNSLGSGCVSAGYAAG